MLHMNLSFLAGARRSAMFGVAFLLTIGTAIANIGPDTPGRLMQDLARDYGLSGHQSAGIVGNFAVETGNFRHQQELNPLAGRGGYGMAQWTASRRRDLFSYAASRGLDVSSYEAQYGFFRHEIDNSPSYQAMMDRMRNAATPAEAAEIFMREYERPGIPHLDARIAAAEAAAAGEFGSITGGTGYGGGGMGGSEQPLDLPGHVLMPWA